MNYRDPVETSQDFNGKNYLFEPDSSPKAWKHYSEFYKDAFWDLYDIDNPQFFTYVFDKKSPIKYGQKPEGTEDWHNYVNMPIEDNNRLFAISDKSCINRSNINFYRAQLHLGGDTDFNFNEKKGHASTFEKILEQGTVPRLKAKGLELLAECRKMHHTLLNFSLMQSMGALQRFKGCCCDDRLDRFVFFLEKYYEMSEKENACVLSYASCENRDSLIQYLDSFESVYGYCKKVYFIQEESFVHRLCEVGGKILKEPSEVIEYMELARDYWAMREEYFTQIQCRMCGIRKLPSAYNNERDVCDDCLNESHII